MKREQAIGGGRGSVGGIVNGTPIDIATVLLAAMQRDMDAARRTVLALPGNEHVAGVAQAERSGIMGLGVSRLVETPECPGQRPPIGSIQRPVNVLENNSGLVVAALVDIGDRVVRAVVQAGL